MLKFDVKRDSCEVPSCLIREIAPHRPTTQEEVATIIMPLCVDNYSKVISGAEAMLKYFVRNNRERLNKAVTPKGETYYGNNGIILDKDFNPLFLSTALIHYEEQIPVIDSYKIHLHPNVFIDDTKVLNKALAKKGVAFFLTHSRFRWGGEDIKYKVEIDDCSQFIVGTKKPNINHCSPEDFSEILKENIDEVLKQITDDFGR
jgi:hypothetical protein